MTPYQSFLIAPFKSGLDTDQEPWLLPQDAFEEITDAHVHEGVLEKRSGYSRLAEIVHGHTTNWVISNITQANPAVVTVSSTTGLSDGDIITIRNVVGMTEVNGLKYKIANSTGTTFELQDADGNNVNSSGFTAYGSAGNTYLIPQNRVMGLWQYIEDANNISDPQPVKVLLAFDTARVAEYNPTSQHFEPIDNSDIAAASDTQYVWAANWTSVPSSQGTRSVRIYFTYDEDYDGTTGGIRHFSGGTTTTFFQPQVNGASNGYINGCRLIFTMKDRLILLNTIEGETGGTNNVRYAQRARWCQAQNPDASDAWDDNVSGKGGFVDAATSDHIVSAQQLQDIIIVFFTNSVWTLRPTSDPALPFRWDRINSFRACDAKMASAPFDRYAIAGGLRGLTATDGVETQRVDQRIEDFVRDDINDAEWDKVFMKRSFGERRNWTLYPSSEASDADSALVFDDNSAAWSKYDIDMNVLGYGGVKEDATLEDFGDDTLDGEFGDRALDSFFNDDGSELFVGGDRNGVVYEMENGCGDAIHSIDLSIIAATQANPVVVTVGSTYDLSDGDVIYIDSVAGMTELNANYYLVSSKTGSTFALQDLDGNNVDGTGFTAYTSGGSVLRTESTDIGFDVKSAAWNPWMSEGRQAQMGYMDIFADSNTDAELVAKFFVNNDVTPYKEVRFDLIPTNIKEVGQIGNITRANPGQVSCSAHGLSDGDTVYLYKIQGMKDLNGGPYTVTVVDDDRFTIGVDTSGYQIYTGRGVVTRLPNQRTKTWKRIFAGAKGYQHRVEFESGGVDQCIRIHAFMPWFRPAGVRPQ